MCVWVSGASLDSLSPGPQRRHRGRLQRVSLRRDARGRSFHVSAKRELTLKRNRQLDTKNVARPAHAGPGLIMPRPTQHRGCASPPRHAPATAARPAVGAASEPRTARSGPTPTDAVHRAAPTDPGSAPPRGLFFVLLFSLTLRPRGAGGASLFTRLTRLTRGIRKNNVSTYRRAKGHTHRVPRGRRTARRP